LGGSTPQPAQLDPNQVSNAQTASNVSTARQTDILNALNLNSPFGSSSYQYDPKSPQNQGFAAVAATPAMANVWGNKAGKDISRAFGSGSPGSGWSLETQGHAATPAKAATGPLVPTSQTITLNPQVQSFLNSQLGLSNTMAGKAQAAAGRLPTGAFDPNSIPDTSDIANKTYQSELALQQPGFDAAKLSLDTQLSNRGLPMGSQASNIAENQYQTTKGNLLNSMSMDASLASGNEQQRLLGNALTERALPYQELSSLEGQTPAVQTPNFANQTATGIQGTNTAGNAFTAYNNQLNAYNAGQQQNSSMLSTLGSLGGAGIAKSSKEYKHDIKPADPAGIMAKFRELPVSDYKYKAAPKAIFGLPESRTGPMAENYNKLFGTPNGNPKSTIDMADAMGNVIGGVKDLDQRILALEGR